MLVHGAGEVLVPAHLHFGKFILDRLRETDPERNCLISNTTKYNLTFKEVSQFVVRLSVGLTQQGVGKGDTVVVAGEPPGTSFPTGLAVILTGATLALIDIQCGEAILKHKLNLTKPKYIICTRKFLEAFSDVLKGSNFIKTFICFDDVEGMESVATLVSSQEVDMDQFEPTAVEGQTDVALISFSSGTTGLSKGVLLTHLNLIARSISITQWYFDYNSLYAEPLQVGFFSEPDRTSFYDFNMMCTLLCSGQTVVYSESDVDLKYVKEFQVHTMPTVPAIIEMMVNAPDLSSLKLVCTVGSPLNRRTAKLLQERYPGIKLVNLYGTTETGSITTTQNKAFDFDVVQQDPKADGYCVGYAVPGVTIKVVDVETRKILGPNQRGELCVRGPRLMKDYLGATEPYLDEQGYYLTGDLGYFDDQKRIYLVNRLKDVINYMGQKVSPGDVESVLLQHPAVQEAAVVGKPAGVEGEELPTAFVVLRAGTAATETELVHYVAKQVTWYMQLRGGVRFVLELPRNAMQKVLRRRLREILTQE